MMTPVERTISTTSTKLTARSSSSSISTSRKQIRFEFSKHYAELCRMQHAHPLSAVKQHLDKGVLDFVCDRIKFDEWWTIINALSSDLTLHLVAVRSRHTSLQVLEAADTELKARGVTKQPVITTRFVLLWLVEALGLCLSRSSALTVLELEGLPVAGDYLASLCRGLLETTSLQHLSLSRCNIQDEGVALVCHSVRNLPSVVSLDLSHCGLTDRGAEAIAGLIKYQKINRYSEAWKQTLRYRDPDVEAMPGLRRITLNDNPEFGDKGVLILIEEIKDDLWLRALDIQNCGITDEGARTFLDLLENNSNLVVFDARGNPFISEGLLSEIMNQLALNNRDKSESEYKWISKSSSISSRPRPWTCQSIQVSGRAPAPTERSTATTWRNAVAAAPSDCATWKNKGSSISDAAAWRTNKGPPSIDSTAWRNNKGPTPTDSSVWRNNKGQLPSETRTWRNNNCTAPNRSELERLRLQIQNLTVILNQEVQHKLELFEENVKLKELVEKVTAEKKHLEEEQDKKVLIAEDTLQVLEETIARFGMYLTQKEDEEEETSEPTTARSSEDLEIPELVSNLRLLLKKAGSSANSNTDKEELQSNEQKEKIKYSKSDSRGLTQMNNRDKKMFIDVQIGDRKDELENHFENHRVESDRKKKSRWLTNRAKDQIIWEEEETNSNCGDGLRISRKEMNKSKAQVMFAKMMEVGTEDNNRNRRLIHGKRYSADAKHYQDDSTSDDSDYDSKSAEIAEKPLTSSYEENSS